MTIDQKRNALRAFCKNHDICEGCVLEQRNLSNGGGCYSEGAVSDVQVSENFDIVFGDESSSDPVNHPAHYESGKYECIDVMTEALGEEATKGFCLCNAFKYIYRCKKKHDAPIEDVQKALWYLKKFLELEGVDHD